MSHEEEKSTGVKDSWAGVKDSIAGAMGGVGLVIVGHPLDTIKVISQTTKGSSVKMTDILKSTIKERGFTGFYSGALAPLIGNSAMNALVFLGYTSAARFVRKDGDISKLSVSAVCACAAFGGTLEALAESPQDLIKCKLQARQTKAKGSISCFMDILKNYGIRGLSQGFSATIIRNIPGNMFYFGLYEVFKRIFAGGNSKNATKLQIFLAGGIGGMGYWISSYPLDVIKSVYQTQHSDVSKRKYKNYVSCARGMYQEFGIQGFFKGWIPCMIRSFPANAACFFCYEVTKKFLDERLGETKKEPEFTYN